MSKEGKVCDTSTISTHCREKEAILKGEYTDEEGQMPAKIKKMKTLKRIEEYEKFEANCQMMKELEKEKRVSMSRDVMQRRNTIMVEGEKRTEERKVKLRRANSIPSPLELSPEPEFEHRGSFSMPVLPDEEEHISLDDKIIQWRFRGGSSMKKGWIRASSLPALVEEEEDGETISIKSKRRSKSIDSFNMY